MRTPLIAESALVALAGLPLALFPSTTIFLLLGAELDDQVGTFVGRGAGAALLTLGIACWLARNGRHERATTELIVALLLYDTAVVVVFSFARSAPGLSGIDLWPAVEVHLGLGVCYLVCLGKELRDNYQPSCESPAIEAAHRWESHWCLAGSAFALPSKRRGSSKGRVLQCA